MKQLISNILRANTGLLVLFFFTFAFCLQLINTDFVINDKVWYEHLAQQEDEKYSDEYDNYIADFEDDLKELDLGEEQEEDAYGWDFFFMDSAMVLAPFLIACVGLAALIFIGFQFSESQKHISFTTILKSSIFAYFVFYLKEIYMALYFLVFKSNYQFEDVQEANNQMSFALRDVIGNIDKSSWMFDILKDINLYFLVYILAIPFFLHIATNRPYAKLLQNIVIPALCGFVLYESIYTYIAI